MCMYPEVDFIHPRIHLLIQQTCEGFLRGQASARSGLELGLPREGCSEGLERGEAMG